MLCAPADGVLRSLGFGNASRPIDLLSVDVEGAEAEVLRCFPFRDFDVRHVLMETAMVKERDLRVLLRFFNRHGYAAIETFAHGKTKGSQGFWLDNLFEYRGPNRYPPTLALDCEGRTPLKKHTLAFCAAWQMWSPSSKPWGRCEPASGSADLHVPEKP